MIKKWKPINFRGAWNYDPRGEIAARAAYAEAANDSYVSIPIELAHALANLRECKATTQLLWDDFGVRREPPITITCIKPQGHEHSHYNGYCTWEQEVK